MILPDQAAKELEPQWFEEGENIRVADADRFDTCYLVAKVKFLTQH